MNSIIYWKTLCFILLMSVFLIFYPLTGIVEAAAVAPAPVVPTLGGVSENFIDFSLQTVDEWLKDALSIPSDLAWAREKDFEKLANDAKRWLQNKRIEINNSDNYTDLIDSYSDQYIVDYIFSTSSTPLDFSDSQALLDFLKQAAYESTIDRSTGSVLFPGYAYNNLNKNVFSYIYGESGWQNRDIGVVDGKPQHVISTYTPEVINVFERLGLKYTMLESITDTHLYYRSGAESNYELGKCYQSFIMKDGKIYILGTCDGEGYFQSFYNGNYASWVIYTVGYTPFSINTIQPYLPKNQTYEVKLVDVVGTLSVAYYSYYVDSSLNRCYEYQFICGYQQTNATPFLFDRPNPDYSYQGNVTVNFQNCATEKALVYTNVLDRTDILLESDVLSGNFDVCGYLQGSQPNEFTANGNLGSAARIMGEYDSPVSGGSQTNTSELTDLEKAIYTLAKQQGIGYEQMLEQSKILIENGQLYIQGVDGIAYSISSLTAQFDRLVEQGQFTADQSAATAEQLKAVLEYLKTLNIEGIEAYIQQIEAALDDLKQGDKDREAVLGDIYGSLNDIKEQLESLGLDSVGADIKSISQALADSRALELEKEEALKDTALQILNGLPSNFPLYDQCKLLLDNLFNYDDIIEPPNFDFYLDMNNDGENEVYRLIDLSILETTLTNNNMVDKSWWVIEIRIIDFIRYLIALVLYGLFVMRLIKRLPDFYGSAPWATLFRR